MRAHQAEAVRLRFGRREASGARNHHSARVQVAVQPRYSKPASVMRGQRALSSRPRTRQLRLVLRDDACCMRVARSRARRDLDDALAVVPQLRVQYDLLGSRVSRPWGGGELR